MQSNFENRIKTLEQDLKIEEDFSTYNLGKLAFENIYNTKVKCVKIRCKCEWYQHGENRESSF